MNTEVDPALLAEMNTPSKVEDDRLLSLRAAVAIVRDMEADKADLEARLKATNIALQVQYFKTLPDLMDSIGVSKLVLQPEGNHPAVTAEAKPFYRANISAEWPPEQQAKGFAYLTEEGAGDLIKTQVTVSFNRDAREDALKFAEAVNQNFAGAVQVKESVPWATLTSWLKEQVEKFGRVPELEPIGGQVGRIVKLKSTED